jgi:hypothetical protein
MLFLIGEKMNHLSQIADTLAATYKAMGDINSAVNFAQNRISTGYVDSVTTTHLSDYSLIRYHKNIFSQSGQDGILQEIFKRLKIENGVFIEFGAWDGIHLSNCRNLALNNWSGLFIEANIEKFNELKNNYNQFEKIKTLNCFVESNGQNNIDSIIDNFKFEDLDLLAIDIDGLDYKIIDSLNHKPKVILMEGGGVISPFVTNRIPDEVAKLNISQSLHVLIDIAKSKGYVAVCYLQDLYLVRNDLAGLFFNYNNYPVELYKDWYFCVSQFSRDFLHNHYRFENSIVMELESKALGEYNVNPISYKDNKKIIIIDIPLNTIAYFNQRNEFKGLTMEWLQYRLNLFFKTTFKSLINQTDLNYFAIIHYMPESELIVKNYLAKCPNIPNNIIFTAVGDALINNLISDDNSEFIYKLRLDSDNMIHPSFVENLKLVNPRKDLECIIGRKGYIYDIEMDRLAYWDHNSSAFNTYIYDIKNYDSNKNLPSTEPEYHMAAVNLNHEFLYSNSSDGRSYLIIIHGNNLQNEFEELVNSDYCSGVIMDLDLKNKILKEFFVY